MTTTPVVIVVYGDAQPAGSKRAAVAKNGRPFVRDANPKSREWKDRVALAAGAVMDGCGLLEGPLSLDVVFYRPRPAGHFGKRGLLPSARPYPTVAPDVTKLVRAIEDALTGIVWRDDAQVVVQWASKFYGEPARVEIHVDVLRQQEVRDGGHGGREAALARGGR